MGTNMVFANVSFQSMNLKICLVGHPIYTRIYIYIYNQACPSRRVLGFVL
jgi:hypothetical protein